MPPNSSLLSDICIDDAEIKRRQEFLTFDQQDAELLKSLNHVLSTQREGLIEKFYAHLQRFQELDPLLGDEEKLAHLKRAQTKYFSQLTEGNYDQSYVNNRLHIGMVHQRVGLTPKWYMSAYCNYLCGVIPQVLSHYAGQPELGLAACNALFKIVFFDMGLALDTYFHAEQKALRLARSYTEQIVSSMPIGFIVLDADGEIGLRNNAVLRIFNLDESVVWQGKTVGQYLGLDTLDQMILQVRESGKHCVNFEFERDDAVDKRTYLADISLARMGGERVVLFMVQDITSRKQSEEKVHRLAFYDALTNLPNRRLLHERIQQSMSISARTERYSALMFLDMDNFKTINDTQGHDAGDVLLKEVANRLSRNVREGDTVARLGGDEFVVALESLSSVMQVAAAQSEAIAEKVRAELSLPYLINGTEHFSSPSIGVSLFCGHQASLDEVMKQADLAMYQAKAGGRNMVCFFDPEMQAKMESRARLEKDLRESVRLQQLHLYYQMQVDDSGRIVGAEALIRWVHPQRGLVSPAQFIPLAEEIGMIIPIGDWVIEQACAQLKIWEMDPLLRKLKVAVNVSPRQLAQPYFVEQVKEAIEKNGINASRLKLELTESLIMKDVDDAIEKMQELRYEGIRFAMDDFGTGYSSLSYLKRLPLEQLKIDQSFVRDIGRDKNSSVMVRTIINIAINFDLKVIAEGVETDEQLAFLRQYGCDGFQGYLFGKPVPAHEFERICLTLLLGKTPQ